MFLVVGVGEYVQVHFGVHFGLVGVVDLVFFDHEHVVGCIGCFGTVA